MIPRLALVIVLASCERAVQRGGTPSGMAATTGRFAIRLELEPSPPALGEFFAVRTAVSDARTGAPVVGAEVTVDATMPEHAHGMVTRPLHRELGGGRYQSDGLKFHMPGLWRLHVNARQGSHEEAAVFDFEQPAGGGR